MKNIVLFAPHQDDEILSACLFLERMKSQHFNVSVIFATNGDANGPCEGKIRAEESLYALSEIGIEEKDIYFMGYGDTGYQSESSFLYRIYLSNDMYINTTPYSDKTYHPLGLKTFHSFIFGNEAVYNRKNFVLDINTIINYLEPDILILPSAYDSHFDHKALAFFFNDILRNIRKSFTVYSYLIHSGNDIVWPDRDNIFFSCPSKISNSLWNTRKNFEFSDADVERKRNVINIFNSQSPKKFNNYLISFAKKEEFFLLEYTKS